MKPNTTFLHFDNHDNFSKVATAYTVTAPVSIFRDSYLQRCPHSELIAPAAFVIPPCLSCTATAYTLETLS